MPETDETYLELYKLHAELADRVSQRRSEANRLHVSLAVGLMVLLSALIRFGDDRALEEIVTVGTGIFGVLISLSWFLVIRSYRQLNSEKFRVLHELEDHLPFQFFKNEWDPEKRDEKSNDYLQLTRVEPYLPLIFGLLFFAIALFAWFGMS